ncbi:MAG TPA: S8 family peptidase [Baekduia sp.]|uniref:S8 family peptidase n=1 Tax=Baekduia sp. TaxID=2600305 RepID=UPI002BCB04AE|nr:S8 family peptidase [Baekduia sp.]HMJ37754.1 S8 family peptidase [Baekduia sp.]
MPSASTSLAVVAGLVVGAIASAPAAASADAVPGQLVVGFHGSVSSPARQRVIEQAGGRLVRRLSHIDGTVVRVRAKGLALSALQRRLRGQRGVRYAEPDYYLKKSTEPDDPLYAEQYALAATGAGAVNAPVAWTARTTCAKVAVLDTGAQYSHPDLTGNIWHNSHEVAGNDVDDDHNGYVDDYYGVDLVKGRDSGVDDEGHGTHVSGIIAGHGDNGTGISGLCWTGSVMPVKFMNSRGKGSSSDAVTGIDYAVRMGAKIVNGSFGSSSKSTALADAVDYAQSKGVLLVFAAGNDGTSNDSAPEYPAALTDSNIIAVAAVTTTGALASFSNYGTKSVDLGAPGDSIISTYLGSGYKVLSGTSMASPIVAAAAAMLRSRDPHLSYSQLRSAILSSTQPDAALAGKVAHPGVLDVGAALASAP